MQTNIKTEKYPHVDLSLSFILEGARSVVEDSLKKDLKFRRSRIQTEIHLGEGTSIVARAKLIDFDKFNQYQFFMKHRQNDYLNFTLGHLKPYFGLENNITLDSIYTHTQSQQYKAFNKSNWQGFNLGIGIFGSLKNIHIPLNYFLSYTDNTKSKDERRRVLNTRVELLSSFMKLGLNNGINSWENDLYTAYGIDLELKKQVNHKTFLGLQTEYKKGKNLDELRKNAIKEPRIQRNKYNIEGFYISPSITHKLNNNIITLKSIQLSGRYEYLSTYNNNWDHYISTTLSLYFIRFYRTRISVSGLFGTDQKETSYKKIKAQQVVYQLFINI